MDAEGEMSRKSAISLWEYPSISFRTITVLSLAGSAAKARSSAIVSSTRGGELARSWPVGSSRRRWPARTNCRAARVATTRSHVPSELLRSKFLRAAGSWAKTSCSTSWASGDESVRRYATANTVSECSSYSARRASRSPSATRRTRCASRLASITRSTVLPNSATRPPRHRTAPAANSTRTCGYPGPDTPVGPTILDAARGQNLTRANCTASVNASWFASWGDRNIRYGN